MKIEVDGTVVSISLKDRIKRGIAHVRTENRVHWNFEIPAFPDIRDAEQWVRDQVRVYGSSGLH